MRFEFATATRIMFGSGVLKEIAPEIVSLDSRIFFVTGSSPRRYSSFQEQLHENGGVVTVFSVTGEPTVDLVNEGTDRARECGCTSVVAVGGGSVIDAGKAIAAMVNNNGNLMDYLEVIGRGKRLEALPVSFIAIPTTAGTGAEVTKNAVITSPQHEVKVSLRHPSMLPHLAAVDPELTLSLPPEISAATGLDALTQCIEAFVSRKATPLTDGFCREGIKRAARSLKTVCTNGDDPAAREDMALASLLSGLALANAGLGAVHGFAGPIGGICGASHGAVCARLLPHVMKANVAALSSREPDSPAIDRYREVAMLLTGNRDAAVEDGVAWIESLDGELPVPEVKNAKLTNDFFPEIAQAALRASSMKGNPVQLTEAQLMTILKESFP